MNEPQRRYVSRKDLGLIFKRSKEWVDEVIKNSGIADYGGRYDPQEVREQIKAGYVPFVKPRPK